MKNYSLRIKAILIYLNLLSNSTFSHSFLYLTIPLILMIFGCKNDSDQSSVKRLIILVEKRLSDSLSISLQQYKSDLQAEEYIAEITDTFGSDTLPESIREFLQKEYDRNDNLSGAILIGNIPAPLFNEKKYQGDDYFHDYLCDYFYMDLDGHWEDTDSDGTYDLHSDTKYNWLNKIRKKFNSGNNLTPEIWVSRIRADMLTSLGDELTLLRDYLRRNHEYRKGTLRLPSRRAFVASDGIDVLRSGWGARPELIYSGVNTVMCDSNVSDSLRKFLNSQEGFELGIINVFSGPGIHHFCYFHTGLDTIAFKSAESRTMLAEYSSETHTPLDISWKDIAQAKPNILFYHLLTSETGRHDQSNYLAGTYIFSGLGLIAIAGTQHSGSVGTTELYEYLAKGLTFGEAWKKALKDIALNAEETISNYWCSRFKEPKEYKRKKGGSLEKAVLIGDGTLVIKSSR